MFSSSSPAGTSDDGTVPLTDDKEPPTIAGRILSSKDIDV